MESLVKAERTGGDGGGGGIPAQDMETLTRKLERSMEKMLERAVESMQHNMCTSISESVSREVLRVLGAGGAGYRAGEGRGEGAVSGNPKLEPPSSSQHQVTDHPPPPSKEISQMPGPHFNSSTSARNCRKQYIRENREKSLATRGRESSPVSLVKASSNCLSSSSPRLNLPDPSSPSNAFIRAPMPYLPPTDGHLNGNDTEHSFKVFLNLPPPILSPLPSDHFVLHADANNLLNVLHPAFHATSRQMIELRSLDGRDIVTTGRYNMATTGFALRLRAFIMLLPL